MSSATISDDKVAEEKVNCCGIELTKGSLVHVKDWPPDGLAVFKLSNGSLYQVTAIWRKGGSLFVDVKEAIETRKKARNIPIKHIFPVNSNQKRRREEDGATSVIRHHIKPPPALSSLKKHPKALPPDKLTERYNEILQTCQTQQRPRVKGGFFRDVNELFSKGVIIESQVPLYLAQSPMSILGTKDGPQKYTKMLEMCKIPAKVDFANPAETTIPVAKGETTEERKFDKLSQNLLGRVATLVGKNLDNLGAILMLLYRFQEKLDFNPWKESAEKPSEDMITFLKSLDRNATALIHENKNPVRTAWLSWSFAADEEHDCLYGSEMQEWRKEKRKNFFKDRGIEQSEERHHLDKVYAFHKMCIISYSQQTQDSKCEQTFYNLFANEMNHDARSIVEPLAFFQFHSLLLYYADFFKFEGMQKTKALTFLEICLVSFLLWDGGISPKLEELTKLYQIGPKKGRIALNATGVVDGVGTDAHVERVISNLFDVEESAVDGILAQLPASVAINVNGYIGEICQQRNLGAQAGLKWVDSVFGGMVAENEDLKPLVDKWRDTYPVTGNEKKKRKRGNTEDS